MKNKTLTQITRNLITELLLLCTESEINLFKRMYSNNVNKNIKEVINEMEVDKLDHALTQCENTLKKNKIDYIIETTVT